MEDLSTLLETDLSHGLDEAEAEDRLGQFGYNTVTKRKGKGRLRLLLSQFTQGLILILIVAGIVTVLLEEWIDSSVIFGVVVVNALVGFVQEWKAIKAIEGLSESITPEATVIRNGKSLRVPAAELVPGDLVLVQAGERVPADLRLIKSHSVRMQESGLTGESVPVAKQATALKEDVALGDRINMAYASTLAVGGQGMGVVVATGDGTEMGKTSGLIAEAEKLKTPLTRKIAQLSRLLLFVIIGMAGLTFIVGMLRGESAPEMFVAVVALAVGAVPEGLPAAVSIVLAIGVSRMARRRAIIRHLPAVETLGSTTVICSDKTGTLTENQMTVQTIACSRTYLLTGCGYDPDGELIDSTVDRLGDVRSDANIDKELEQLLLAGTLCNDSSVDFDGAAWRISGDPTEAALIVSAMKAGIDNQESKEHLPRLDTLPFESEFQYMATLHSGAPCQLGFNVIYVKGSPERLLAYSAHQGDGVRLDSFIRASIEERAREMASVGLRVLAFAYKQMPSSTAVITRTDVQTDLVFLGLQGMIDPPRQEVLPAIKTCHQAGIQVKMLTGDHVLTALAIADQLKLGGMDGDTPRKLKALTGSELLSVSDEDLVGVVEETVVFARVSPEQKLRLVRALQRAGNTVAATGDGINDAPALRQADIGVAMGITGSEVAKEASDMVLTDDNFASIEAAVEEGRGVFDNLRKFISWTLPTNLAEGLVVLVATFAGMLLPILPVQILWINMTTAVLLGTGLAFEPKEVGIMQRPPRSSRTPLVDRPTGLRVVMVAAVLLIGAFFLFDWAIDAGCGVERARTAAANVIVFGEIAFLFNCRSLRRPSWRVGPLSNPILLGGVVVMIGLQMLFTYLPGMNRLFNTAPIAPTTWLWIFGLGLGVHVIVEIERWIRSPQTIK